MDHEVLDRSDLKEALTEHRRALVAAANDDTPTALFALCALGGVLIAFASRASERLAKLERGAGLLIALALATASQGCAVDANGPADVQGSESAMGTYAVEIETAIDTWTETYDFNSYTCDPSTLRVLVEPPGERFNALCGDPGNPLNPRTAHRIRGCFPGGHNETLIVIAEQWAAEAHRTMTHELQHWLARCSNTHWAGDCRHEDPLIWRPGGTLDRTNRALGLPHD